jgi:hypothetical protein
MRVINALFELGQCVLAMRLLNWCNVCYQCVFVVGVADVVVGAMRVINASLWLCFWIARTRGASSSERLKKKCVYRGQTENGQQCVDVCFEMAALPLSGASFAAVPPSGLTSE